MSKDSTIDKCNFCFLAEELDSEKIEYWSKKSDNYSPYPKMVSCDENYSLKNEELKELEPELGENPLNLQLTLGEEHSNKHVYYWATNESSNIHEILPPGSAYGEYENHGLKKCDDEGDVTLVFNTPQPYKEGKKTHPRHVHYILEDDNKVWRPLKTIRVICTISIDNLDERIKMKDTMIINALPTEYFGKERIPNSVNLPVKELDKLTTKSVERRVLKLLKSSLKKYPKLEELVNDKKIELYDIPIITYCAHSKCDASEKLIHALYSCGVNNVLEWKEGMEGWNKKRSFFGDDSAEDDDSDIEEDQGPAEPEPQVVSESEEDDEDDGDDEDDEDDDLFEDEDDILEETESSDEDDFIEIIHDGVEYFYSGDTLYDSYMEPIGKVKVVNDKIIDMDEKVQAFHDQIKEKSEKETVKSKPKPKKDKVEYKSDEFTEELLSDHVGGKGGLKSIVQKIAEREKGSYNFGELKNMKKSDLVKIALVCQGKKKYKNTKTDYEYKTESEIEKMSASELREMLNQMIEREPGTFKYTESSWSKPKLIDFILTCHGSSKPRDLGVKVFVGGGWTL
jgi:rhodanese-related sulfurtransferase